MSTKHTVQSTSELNREKRGLDGRLVIVKGTNEPQSEFQIRKAYFQKSAAGKRERETQSLLPMATFIAASKSPQWSYMRPDVLRGCGTAEQH